MMNVTKLHQELQAAGIPIEGVSSSGRIDFLAEATKAQRDQAAQIAAAHDPNAPLKVDVVLGDAKGQAANIPSWATWTQAQLQSWWDANLSDAKVDAIQGLSGEVRALLKAQNRALLNIGLMEIAIRNQLWPDLQA